MRIVHPHPSEQASSSDAEAANAAESQPERTWPGSQRPEAPDGQQAASEVVDDAQDTVDADGEADGDGGSGADADSDRADPGPGRGTGPLGMDPIIAALRAEVVSKDEQLHRYIAAYKEAKADMDRERERLHRDRQRVLDQDRKKLAENFLEVLDNFDRSRAVCKPGASIEDVAAGLDLVRKQFTEALTKLGIERMATVGERFDASRHEATGMIPAQADQADQEIVFEERAGYTINEKLLRAARVVIASKGR